MIRTSPAKEGSARPESNRQHITKKRKDKGLDWPIFVIGELFRQYKVPFA
jgi:hypothetical protein